MAKAAVPGDLSVSTDSSSMGKDLRLLDPGACKKNAPRIPS